MTTPAQSGVATPRPVPAPRYGVFADLYGDGPRQWCRMSFTTPEHAHRVAARLALPYEVLPLPQ